MANLAELKWYLSGGSTGSGNTDTTKSTGGVITTTVVLSQLATASSSPISGVTLGDAAGNALGAGSLIYTYSATTPTFRWQPYQGSAGTAITVTADGTYAIPAGSNNGVLNITVVFASLPGASKTDTVTITSQSLKIFDAVTKEQARTGLVEYRCLYLKNTGTTATTDDKANIAIFIANNTTGADTISIGLATQAPGTGTGVSGTDYPADTTSETGVPAGVTFSAPTSAAPLTAFNLTSTAGSTYTKALWICRTVPAGTYEQTLGNTFDIGYDCLV